MVGVYLVFDCLIDSFPIVSYCLGVQEEKLMLLNTRKNRDERTNNNETNSRQQCKPSPLALMDPFLLFLFLSLYEVSIAALLFFTNDRPILLLLLLLLLLELELEREERELGVGPVFVVRSPKK